MEWNPLRVGRYVLFSPIASGGMASVHLGRMVGTHFSRTVAIKRLHPYRAAQPGFVDLFREEALLAQHIRHPNVVVPTDVVSEGTELFLVMEYVEGESLSFLLRASSRAVPEPIAAALVLGVLYGLDSAHRAVAGDIPLGIVHRDVSPQNILVGVDGIPRLVDFGLAKAVAGTWAGNARMGKLPYMAPEQILGATIDARTDLWATGVVLWEALCGERLFPSESFSERLADAEKGSMPEWHRSRLPTWARELLTRTLAARPDDRYGSASELAAALEKACRPASPLEVAEWVSSLASERIAARKRLIAAIEARAARETDENGEASAEATQSAGASPRGEDAIETTPIVSDDPVIRSQSSYVFASHAQRRGHLALLEKFGVRPGSDPPDLRWPLSTIRAFATELADVDAAPNLGLTLGMAAPRGVYGIFEYVVRSARNVREACERLVRYQRLVDATIGFALYESVSDAVLAHFVPGCAGGLGRHGNEFAVAILVGLFRDATGAPDIVQRVCFSHAPPADQSAHQRFFQCPIEWNWTENNVRFSHEALEAPMRIQDEMLARVLREQADELLARIPAPLTPEGPALTWVQEVTAAELGKGHPAPHAVARRLRMSEEALVQHLGRQGLTFEELVDDVRRARARTYLNEGKLRVEDIAFLLGFSNMQAFQAARARWDAA